MRPIKTEVDHQAALKEIDRLFDVEPNTSEDDKLKMLITLVVAYEEEHYNIPKPNLVEIIKYRVQSRACFRRYVSFWGG